MNPGAHTFKSSTLLSETLPRLNLSSHVHDLRHLLQCQNTDQYNIKRTFSLAGRVSGRKIQDRINLRSSIPSRARDAQFGKQVCSTHHSSQGWSKLLSLPGFSASNYFHLPLDCVEHKLRGTLFILREVLLVSPRGHSSTSFNYWPCDVILT